MLGFYDVIYAVAAAALAPVWLVRAKSRHKVSSALRNRMGYVAPRESRSAAIWIHAVSLGEMNATRALVGKLREARPDVQIIISTTTHTGYERGLALYADKSDITLVRYPLDLTPAVKRALDRLRPSVVVLIELEVWPNFLKHCGRRGIPVLVINARLTTSSFRNYRWGGVLVRRIFRRVAMVCAQDEVYAERFKALGVPDERVRITGTMKFDNAEVTDYVPGDLMLAGILKLRKEDGPIWVCGSTGPGEEQIILETYRALLRQHSDLRLVLVPRHPERFDEVTELVRTAGMSCIRRSQPGSRTGTGAVFPPVIIGDTMGELRKFYSLADVVFVGRSIVDLGPRQHGSDMIEPAALGKAVIVGPFTNNFAEAVAKFREARAIVEVQAASELDSAVARLLENPGEAREMGRRAAEVVKQNQGATERHARIILETLEKYEGGAAERSGSTVIVGGV
jgi:3-deoxy-D-manno-octulosonic-acid transferase